MPLSSNGNLEHAPRVMMARIEGTLWPIAFAPHLFTDKYVVQATMRVRAFDHQYEAYRKATDNEASPCLPPALPVGCPVALPDGRYGIVQVHQPDGLLVEALPPSPDEFWQTFAHGTIGPALPMSALATAACKVVEAQGAAYLVPADFPDLAPDTDIVDVDVLSDTSTSPSLPPEEGELDADDDVEDEAAEEDEEEASSEDEGHGNAEVVMGNGAGEGEEARVGASTAECIAEREAGLPQVRQLNLVRIVLRGCAPMCERGAGWSPSLPAKRPRQSPEQFVPSVRHKDGGRKRRGTPLRNATRTPRARPLPFPSPRSPIVQASVPPVPLADLPKASIEANELRALAFLLGGVYQQLVDVYACVGGDFRWLRFEAVPGGGRVAYEHVPSGADLRVRCETSLVHRSVRSLLRDSLQKRLRR